jgi:hypothetical protein
MYWLTVLEAGKSNIKTPASARGAFILRQPMVEGTSWQKGKERERGAKSFLIHDIDPFMRTEPL